MNTIKKNFTSKQSPNNSLKDKIKNLVRKNLYSVYTSFSIYDPRKGLSKTSNTINFKGKFDLIISSSDPKSSHVIAEKLMKSKTRVCDQWIQYWGDPFAVDINRKSLLPKKFIQYEENRILKLADKIIYVSPFTLELQKELFPDIKNKAEFLPIPYLETKFSSKKNHNEVLNIGYFGDYYSNDRNIIPLYESIKNSSHFLKICGYGDISLQQNSNIEISPRVSYDNVKKFEEESDLLVCICNRRGTQIPGKVYHYAGTDKPILIILDGENNNELKEYFKSFGRYIMCNNDSESISKAILEVKNKDIKYEPSKYFNPSEVARKFLLN